MAVFSVEQSGGRYVIIRDGSPVGVGEWANGRFSFDIEDDQLGGGAATGTVNIPFYISEGGVPAVEEKLTVLVPFAATITGWYITADAVGSIVFDIWKDAFTNGVPTNADSITAAAKPSLTDAQTGSDTTLTGWTTSIAENDLLTLEIESVETIQKVTLNLVVERV